MSQISIKRLAATEMPTAVGISEMSWFSVLVSEPDKDKNIVIVP